MTIKPLLDDCVSSEMEKLPLVFLGWLLFFSKWNLRVHYNTVNNNLDDAFFTDGSSNERDIMVWM